MNYPEPFEDYLGTMRLKLTSLRRAVLYILWSSSKPLKAYEILEDLLLIKPNSTPPTVYRALLFFLSSGVVHKIESIQSYTLCCEPAMQWPSELLMLCVACYRVIEVYDSGVQSLMTQVADNYSFKLRQDSIELKGICVSCSQL